MGHFYLNYRKRREEGRDNLSQIKAEMETVYNVQGKGDAGSYLRTYDLAEFRQFSKFFLCLDILKFNSRNSVFL